jgi:RNA-directed DNA polymerase
MRGNSSRGNRETSQAPSPDGGGGRPGKAKCPEPGMHAGEESDGFVVPTKPANGGGETRPEERVEGRGPAKGNTEQASMRRAQDRESMVDGLDRVREAARRDKEARFTTLLHHITFGRLQESFYALKREAAPGIDGVTWREYEVDLEIRLGALLDRVHRGSYRAQPSKRTYIPKPDGRKRPLGIASLEDKIVQQAVVTVLSAIYEVDFLGNSYAYRLKRTAHDALDALSVGIADRRVNWVFDADIRGFFDNIDHGWMHKFIEHRIADPRVLRLISKWLTAGVSEDGEWSETTVGTPQGAVISPLLANVYLHYVLDQWVVQWRKHCTRGEVIYVRYADDFVLGFEHRDEAECFRGELSARLAKFGLSLHPEKTRLIEFGRNAARDRERRGDGKPETFDFLGFTHYCGKTRKTGRFQLKRKSISKRQRSLVQKVKERLRKRMHDPIADVGRWLSQVLRGYYQFHAVPGNIQALGALRTAVTQVWRHVLRRRSEKSRMTWRRMAQLVERWLPRPRILHPYPERRFYAKYPRQEPYAVVPHVRICTGGRPKGRSLP